MRWLPALLAAGGAGVLALARSASAYERAPAGPGGRLLLRTTAYWPFTATEGEKKLEGGTQGAAAWRGKKAVDPLTGKRPELHTLEDAIAGRTPYASLAGDPDVWPFGQRLEIDAWPGVVFRVVDTGGSFKGANKKYRSDGAEPIDVCVDSKKTKVPETTGARIVTGDNFEGGTLVAISKLRGQTVSGYTILGAGGTPAAPAGRSVIPVAAPKPAPAGIQAPAKALPSTPVPGGGIQAPAKALPSTPGSQITKTTASTAGQKAQTAGQRALASAQRAAAKRFGNLGAAGRTAGQKAIDAGKKASAAASGPAQKVMAFLGLDVLGLDILGGPEEVEANNAAAYADAVAQASDAAVALRDQVDALANAVTSATAAPDVVTAANNVVTAGQTLCDQFDHLFDPNPKFYFVELQGKAAAWKRIADTVGPTLNPAVAVAPDGIAPAGGGGGDVPAGGDASTAPADSGGSSAPYEDPYAEEAPYDPRYDNTGEDPFADVERGDYGEPADNQFAADGSTEAGEEMLDEDFEDALDERDSPTNMTGYHLLGGAPRRRRRRRKQRPVVHGTPEDKQALARAIASSCRKGSIEEKQAVGWVCRNRAQKLGVSVSKLIAPEGIFGPRGEAGREFVGSAVEPDEEAEQVAQVVLLLRANEDPTDGAFDFWNPSQQDRAKMLSDVQELLGVDHSEICGADKIRGVLTACGLRVVGQVGELELLGS